jgi:hypothetical protein
METIQFEYLNLIAAYMLHALVESQSMVNAITSTTSGIISRSEQILKEYASKEFQTVQLLIPGTTAGQGAGFLRSTSGCGTTGGRSPERSQWRMQRR